MRFERGAILQRDACRAGKQIGHRGSPSTKARGEGRPLIGETVSHYRIEGKLGRGGMGIVYKAQDLRLERPVALKFLPVERCDDRVARARFLKEAQSASILDHPNICTIYEVDELDDGRPFIAMACYEGETLRQRIDRGPLPVQLALDVARQAAYGLEEAHRRGIVHRDVKPENLMLTPGGVVKILDFGVAKLAGSEGLTQVGKALGTTAYMAPETLRGRSAEAQSDLWSLGVVLYEMLSGQAPFQGSNPSALILAILQQEPVPLTLAGTEHGDRTWRLIARALEKETSERFPGARAMLEELEALAQGSVSRTIEIAPPEVVHGRRHEPEHGSSIAVLSFLDLSPDRDQEYFCSGLAEELMYCLSRVPKLRVAARTSTFQFAGKPLDVRQIGRQLEVDAVLEGSVRKAGDRLRVTVQLSKAADGYQLWSERYDREMKDLFALQDEIAEQVVAALEITLASSSRMRRAVVESPQDLEAYTLYLRGRFHWNRRTEPEIRRGLACFDRALERDPRYARAWAGVADSYAMLGVYGAAAPEEVMPKALAAAERALALDPEAAEVYASRACVRAVYQWDFLAAVEDFRRSIRLDPRYALAYHWYAVNCLLPNSFFERALTELRRALEIDPLSLALHASVGLSYFYARRYERAVEEHRRTLDIDSGFALARLFLGQALEQLGRTTEAVAELEAAHRLSEGSLEAIAALAQARASAGDGRAAAALLEELAIVRRQRYVSPVLLAQVTLALGAKEASLDLLDEALRLRAADLIWLAVRPAFDPLRGEPRFQAILARVGLPSPAVAERLAEGATIDC